MGVDHQGSLIEGSAEYDHLVLLADATILGVAIGLASPANGQSGGARRGLNGASARAKVAPSLRCAGLFLRLATGTRSALLPVVSVDALRPAR
jgi:hypothetical protein